MFFEIERSYFNATTSLIFFLAITPCVVNNILFNYCHLIVATDVCDSVLKKTVAQTWGKTSRISTEKHGTSIALTFK